MKEKLHIPEYAQNLMIASNQGITEIVHYLSLLINTPVFVTDSLNQVVVSSNKPYQLDASSVIAIERQETIEEFDIFLCQVSTLDHSMHGLSSSILYDNSMLGYINIIFTDEGKEIADYNQILKFSAALCASQMYKKIEIMQEKQKFKDAFLFDLFYGNIKQRENIIEYGTIWGWNLSLPHCVVVFSISEYNPFSGDKQFFNVLLNFIERLLISQNNKPIIMSKENQIIVLFPQMHDDVILNKKAIQSFTSAIITQAKKTLYSNGELACGVGKFYPHPEELFRSYQEAKVAYELGILLNIELPFFTELGLERILYKHDLQDLKEYYINTVGDLEAFDKLTGNDLMETLESFASNQFDMTKTSKSLFLHRNTLRYRLKKIEEILHIKLDDFNIKLDITAAFKIKQLKIL